MYILFYIALVISSTVLFSRNKRLYPLLVFTISSATISILIATTMPLLILWTMVPIIVFINLILLCDPFRALITKYLAQSIHLPKAHALSDTEVAAMESGDTYWVDGLFSSNMDWQQLLSIKPKPLTAKEIAFISTKVPRLCEIFTKTGLGEGTLDFIKEEGFWSLNIPRSYGGLDFSALAHAKILTQLSSISPSLAVTVMVPNSLGPAVLILNYGTELQRTSILPKLATGAEVPCFALTSLTAGSDASSMIDTGIVCHGDIDGKVVIGFRLNWSKRYTTLAPIATLIGLAFKSYDPEHIISDTDYLGITCALVDASLPGITIGRHHHPLGSEFTNGPHQGRDVFIPMSAIIGGPEKIGMGWSMLMESLSLGRGVSLPSLSNAGVQLALKSSIEYSLIRKQFNQSIYRFQGVAEKILPLAADALEMKAMSDFHLTLLDQGYNPSIGSAILKYNHTECLRSNVNRAMDIHAGKAIMCGKKNYLAGIYSVLPIAITVEGANILTRSMIIFGQGLMRCHPYLSKEIDALETQNYSSLNTLIGKHLRHQLHTSTKCLISSICRSTLTKKDLSNMDLKNYAIQLENLSAKFSFLAEATLIKYRTKIKFQETISGLLADLLMRMYGVSTLIKFANELDAEFDDLVSWTINDRLCRAQLAIKSIVHQFKFSMPMGLLLFPYGTRKTSVNVKLQNQIINQLIHNPHLISILTEDVLILKGSPLAELEVGYKLAIKAEEIYNRIGYFSEVSDINELFAAQKITSAEHSLLIKTTIMRQQILEVDDYED